MIVLSASLVVVALGLLVAGVAVSSMALVYVAIALSVVALLTLAVGTMWRRPAPSHAPEADQYQTAAEVDLGGTHEQIDGGTGSVADQVPVPAASSARRGDSRSGGDSRSDVRWPPARPLATGWLTSDKPPADRSADETARLSPVADAATDRRVADDTAVLPAVDTGGTGRSADASVRSGPVAEPPADEAPTATFAAIPVAESPGSAASPAGSAAVHGPDDSSAEGSAGAIAQGSAGADAERAEDSARAAAHERAGSGTGAASPAGGPVTGNATKSACVGESAGPTSAGESASAGESERVPAGDPASGGDADVDRDDVAAPNVTVVPGVPRYHRPDCVLIRFMDADSRTEKPVAAAKQAGCTPCRACQPDLPVG